MCSSDLRGLRSQVAGSIKNLNIEALIDRKLLRFMAKGHAYRSEERRVGKECGYWWGFT